MTLFFFSRCLTPSRQLARHLARAIDDLGEVEGDIAGREAIGIGVLHQMVDLGRAQQRLRRDAAPVEADAPEISRSTTAVFMLQLRGADGRHITAGATADHHQIERHCPVIAMHPFIGRSVL